MKEATFSTPMSADDKLEEAVWKVWSIDPCVGHGRPTSGFWGLGQILMAVQSLTEVMSPETSKSSFWYCAAEVILARIAFQNQYSKTPTGFKDQIKNLKIKWRVNSLVRKISSLRDHASEDQKVLWMSLILELKAGCRDIFTKQELETSLQKVRPYFAKLREKGEYDTLEVLYHSTTVYWAPIPFEDDPESPSSSEG